MLQMIKMEIWFDFQGWRLRWPPVRLLRPI